MSVTQIGKLMMTTLLELVSAPPIGLCPPRLRGQRLCHACESGPLLCVASTFCPFLTQCYAA